MKKLLPIILALCMLIASCLTLASCSTVVSYIHECDFTGEWSKDAESHWHTCSFKFCEEIKDKSAHEWNDAVITTKPTQDADGVKTFTCKHCAQTKTEVAVFTGMTRTEWENALDYSSFKNFQYKEVAVTSGSGISVTSELTYKFTNDSAWAQVKIGNESDEEYTSNTEAVSQARTQLVDSIKDITSYIRFRYDADTKTYKATEKIYLEALDTSTQDVTLTFDDGKLVKIEYSASFVQSGIAFTVTSTITLSSYGTVTINN